MQVCVCEGKENSLRWGERVIRLPLDDVPKEKKGDWSEARNKDVSGW
jgi:hypothetical protein